MTTDKAPVTVEQALPDLIVTKGGVPFADQAEGIRQFKAACLAASKETDRLARDLNIKNADHIALWLEANMADSGLGWLACRIVEAHEQSTAALEEEIKRLREALTDHNEALRSAYQVADREGKDTNWLALRGNIMWALAEHQQIVNNARTALEGRGS